MASAITTPKAITIKRENMASFRPRIVGLVDGTPIKACNAAARKTSTVSASSTAALFNKTGSPK